MRVTNLHRSLCIFLSFLVLFATMTITVNKHYCCGKLIKVAFFQKVKPCCEQKERIGNNPLEKQVHKKCCSDTHQILKTHHQLSVSSFQIPLFFVVFSVVSTLFVKVFRFFKTISIKHYIPPLRSLNLTILYQVFRI